MWLVDRSASEHSSGALGVGVAACYAVRLALYAHLWLYENNTM